MLPESSRDTQTKRNRRTTNTACDRARGREREDVLEFVVFADGWFRCFVVAPWFGCLIISDCGFVVSCSGFGGFGQWFRGCVFKRFGIAFLLCCSLAFFHMLPSLSRCCSKASGIHIQKKRNRRTPNTAGDRARGRERERTFVILLCLPMVGFVALWWLRGLVIW